MLEFTRKVALQPQDLADTDFNRLRDQGLTDGDIIRIIAIAAWALGETLVSRAIEVEPEMPAFAQSLQSLRK